MPTAVMRCGTACAAILLLVACTTPVPATAPTRVLVDVADVAARAAHSATVLVDGAVLIAGGCIIDGCGSATASSFAVTPTGAIEVGMMGDARDAHTATLFGSGQVLVTGGFSGEGAPPLASAEVFDPGTGSWAAVGDLATQRGGHAAALLGSGDVIVVGGWVRSRTYTATTEVFDPHTGSFSPGPSLPSAADGLEAVTLDDGRVLVTGGQAAPGVASGQAVVISADGATLDRVGPLAVARFKHTMVKLDDGRVLVIGGTTDDTALLTSTEIFDPATGRFSPGPAMLHGRYKVTGGATLLPDGRVLVGGGGEGVELIDVVAGVSTPATTATGVASFGTISLSGAVVLFVGGYDARIGLTRRFLAVPVDEL
ncbi:MAG: kelch repeat-containing protein [Pseudolysinimonas sp.]